ncbi:hypothetical protein G6F56_009228 [Rhizopus delemar]|nr:hypothetical protein G6F56_009228 [Rhizopus delemar]
MSNNNLLTPNRRRRYEALKEASYSIDDSDSVESTPKSILKGSNTPLREEYENEQDQNRRVSFAPDANLRIYAQEDTIEFTYNSEEDLFAQPEPPTDLFDSPVHFNT